MSNTKTVWIYGWRDDDQPSDKETISITPEYSTQQQDTSSTNYTGGDSYASTTLLEIKQLTWNSSPEQLSISTP